MASIVVRNIPDTVHDALRDIARERHVSVEALARAALTDLTRAARHGGIDFAKLERDAAALGLQDDVPAWTEAMDDPVFSRRVLGLPDA